MAAGVGRCDLHNGIPCLVLDKTTSGFVSVPHGGQTSEKQNWPVYNRSNGLLSSKRSQRELPSQLLGERSHPAQSLGKEHWATPILEERVMGRGGKNLKPQSQGGLRSST